MRSDRQKKAAKDVHLSQHNIWPPPAPQTAETAHRKRGSFTIAVAIHGLEEEEPHQYQNSQQSSGAPDYQRHEPFPCLLLLRDIHTTVLIIRHDPASRQF